PEPRTEPELFPLSQRRNDFPGDSPRLIQLGGFEADGRYHGVSAPPVAFGKLGEVLGPKLRPPGVAPQRDLGAVSAAANPNDVPGIRVERIGNELVDAVESFVTEIEEHNPVLKPRLLPHQGHRGLMLLPKWLKGVTNAFTVGHLGERRTHQL